MVNIFTFYNKICTNMNYLLVYKHVTGTIYVPRNLPKDSCPLVCLLLQLEVTLWIAGHSIACFRYSLKTVRKTNSFGD